MSDPIEQLHDPDTFVGDFPVWLIFDAGAADPAGNFPADAVLKQILRDVPGEPIFVPIFTDWDLTLRFIMNGNHNACGIPLGRLRLLKLLEYQISTGVTLVSFDPGETIVRTIPAADVFPELG